MGGYEFGSRIGGLRRRRRSSPDPLERHERPDGGPEERRMEEFLNDHSRGAGSR
jgi:hypothetical protein